MRRLRISFCFAVLILVVQLTYANNEVKIVLPLKFITQETPAISLITPTTLVTIQNHKVPLILDSGAGRAYLSLSKNTVKKLNIKLIPTGGSTSDHGVDGKKFTAKKYVIPKVTIGNWTLQDVPCQLIDELWGGNVEHLKKHAAGRNGIVGLMLLRQFNVLLDYKRAQIILTHLDHYPDGYDIKNWKQVPFSIKWNSITTMAKINGVDEELVWDTGAEASALKSTAKIIAKKESCSDHPDKSCQYFNTSTFSIADAKFSNIKFLSLEMVIPFDGFIGSNFIQEHQVFLDFKNNILFIN